VRCEQAIRRDLIVNKAKYFAEHNLDGFLRGDAASRSTAYSLAIQWGWMSRNEVRARENLNPIPGMDQPLTPLNMTGNPGGSSAAPSPGAQSYLRVLVRDAAARVVRKETATLAKLAERTGGTGEEWRRGVAAFYVEHAEFVGRLLRIPDEAAEEYAGRRAAHLIEAGPAALDDFDTSTVADLTDLALERAPVLQLPEAA
jgi:hypothetical protein